MATNIFRVLSRQTAKAVPRFTAGLCLSNTTALRHVHNTQTPYSGPPSYDTLVRRLSSSEVDPQSYYTRKHQQEAKERGEYIDIHDVGGLDPEDYDVLISDVNDEKLRGEVAEVVGPYHAEATKEDANKVKPGTAIYPGGSFGRYFQWWLVMVLGLIGGFFFIVDIGSPLTYLSAQASDLFNISEESGPNLIKTGGHQVPVYRSPIDSHFLSTHTFHQSTFCRT